MDNSEATIQVGCTEVTQLDIGLLLKTTSALPVERNGKLYQQVYPQL